MNMLVMFKSDISFLEGQIQEDKQLIKKYSELVEHIAILCQNDGSKDTKYLDAKPKHAVKWNNISIQKVEEDYGEDLKQ